MEQVLHPIRGVMGDSGTDPREPRQEEQHDREPPEACHRRVQVLRREAHLLCARVLVPVYTGYEE